MQPLQMMVKSQRFIDVFSSLGEEELTEDTYARIEEFICYMYGYKQQTDINMVRNLMFEEKGKPKSVTQRPLDGLKAIYPTSFPPCKRVLEQQIKRAWFIARLYKTASEQYPCMDYSPIDFGWKLSDCRNNLEIDWFHGDQVPEEIDSLTNPASMLSDNDDEDSDNDYEESDSSDSEEDEDFEF